MSAISRKSRVGAIRLAGTSRRMRLGAAMLTVLALAVAALVATPSAGAVTDAEELTRFGTIEGTAAGQQSIPGAAATDPFTGHVYVSDFSNGRINEFTPWGEFVKALGWDVAPAGVNEQQEIRIRATAGTFKLSFGAASTGDLPVGATAAEVEAALDGLATVGAGEVSVEERKGDASGTVPYVYVATFSGPGMKETDVAQIAVASGSIPLSGGNPASSAFVRTRADGGPPGTGLEACTQESGCQEGVRGGGRLNFAKSIAVDPNGNLYVGEESRVLKFDSAGQFVLMIGGDVDETTGENICTNADMAAGDICGVGVSGEGQGEFTQINAIAIGPTDLLYVADHQRIQAFDLDGAFQSKIERHAADIAVDPQSGDLYVISNSEPDVHKLSHVTGLEIGSLKVPHPGGLTIDGSGNVYVVEVRQTNPAVKEHIVEFSSGGQQIASCCVTDLIPGFIDGVSNHYVVQGLTANPGGDVYIVAGYGGEGLGNYVVAYGPPPVSFESPPVAAPVVTEEYATTVDSTGATLRAKINPKFWNDTTYYVEYGTEDCEAGGCAKQPAPPGSRLTTKFSANPLTTADVFIGGLQPDTTYHYRFVAQSSGGGPVMGPDRTFHTFARPGSPETDCPNQEFRVGPSARLPDCRSYEMVSPVDKSGGDILSILEITSYDTGLYQSATDGERVTYSSYRGFGDVKAAPYVLQYMATRRGGAWQTEGLNPAGGVRILGNVPGFQNEYKVFSPDLCHAWLLHDAEPLLAPGAVPGFANLYRREDCEPDVGSFETLTTVTPPSVIPSSYAPEPQGYSADGKTAIYRFPEKLTEDAPAAERSALYVTSGDGLHYVCILPNGTPIKEECAAGTGPGGGVLNSDSNRITRDEHALSDDGSVVYWTETQRGTGAGGLGRIYRRKNPEQPQSAISGAECTEAEMACTVAVSQAGANALFWQATPSGSKALYQITDGNPSLNGNLYLFHAESEETPRRLIAKRTEGVAGASQDLSRIYFVSREAIAGTTGPTEKAPNLYLYEAGEGGEGSYTFIDTLSEVDVGHAEQAGDFPSNTAANPLVHAARASADGRYLAFISTERLTGYDNTDAQTGRPDSEVYLYGAGAPAPLCVSCNPSGSRPAGREATTLLGGGQPLATAASLPLALTAMYIPRVLAADGSRLYFNSFDALVPSDTNGKEDAYEWERPGKGSCREASPAFSEPNSGCIYLISSGESPEDSELIDIGADGRDAFIKTASSLLPQDPGLVDIYDAREGGGLPPPPSPPPACEADACQAPVTAPDVPSPASATFKGAGNAHRSRCTKGNRGRAKGKARANCAKAKKTKAHKRSKHRSKRGGRR